MATSIPIREAQPEEVPNYSASNRCALCQTPFTTLGEPSVTDCDAVVAGISNKDQKLLLIYRRDEQPGRYLMAIITIRHWWDCTRHIYPVGFENVEASKITIRIRHFLDDCRENNSAVTIHLTCWKLASLSSNGNISSRLLWDFKDATERIVLGIKKQNTFQILTHYSNVNYDNTTSTGALLNSLSCLPKEIQLLIAEYSQGGYLTAALNTIQSSSPLLASVVSHEKSKKSLPTELIFNPKFKHLTATWVEIHNHTYMFELHETEDEPCDPDCDTDSLILRPLRGIKFALGKFGIRGLRLLYKDLTLSPWLGSTTHCTFGAILGNDIIGLSIHRDCLKIVRIDLIHRIPTPSSSSLPPKWLWRSDVHFLPSQKHYIQKPTRFSKTNREIKYFPGWAFGTYLSFVQDGVYISALTICFFHRRVSEIIVHDKRGSRKIGDWRDHMVHFPLQESERIAAIWADHGIGQNLALLIVTTFGRTCFCGALSCGDRMFSSQQEAKWSLLTPNTSNPITGIFSDDSNAHETYGLQTLGTTKSYVNRNHPSAEETHALPLPSYPTLTPNVFADLPGPRQDPSGFSYLSLATFTHLTKLQTCREGDRIKGLLLYHQDGLCESFGHWIPFSKHISTIYDYDCSEKLGGKRAIKAIAFYIKPKGESEDEYDYLAAVEIEMEDSVGGGVEAGSILSRDGRESDEMRVLRLEDLGKTLAWISTPNTDSIIFWSGAGTSISLPPSSVYPPALEISFDY